MQLTNNATLKRTRCLSALIVMLCVPPAHAQQAVANKQMARTDSGVTVMNAQTQPQPVGRFAAINGLNLYYEVHGQAQQHQRPLVLLHGGGSTIGTTYGRILPVLAKGRQLIAIELQAHGHTKDIDRPLSFAQDADDVAALLKHLHIDKADIMGFSNGGTTALQMAIRHPQQVNKLVLASATYKRDGMQSGFFEGMQHASLDNMPAPLKQAYRAINPDPNGLQKMFERDVARMQTFTDIADADINAISAPALVLNGDRDVVRPEHALLLSRTLQHASLAILPGGHGDYIGELCAANRDGPLPLLVTNLIDTFLKE
jgi:pimeloyl-ACP methyl ester carboxylesterase